MNYFVGQLIIVLAPYMEQELYTSIKAIKEDKLVLTVKSANILSLGKEILCIAINGTDIFEFYSKVEEIYDNTVSISRPNNSGVSFQEKRRFNRMDCKIGFVGRPLMINDVLMTSSDKQFSGTVLNVSAGGVLIETSLKLPEFMVFKFKLKLNYFLDCTAIVKRTVPSSTAGLFESGCEFMEMPLEDIKTISLFVFREQLKMIRKELNKNATNKQ
ncbi:MAG: PilZ domain-containing protein [Bacillota bacterium]